MVKTQLLCHLLTEHGTICMIVPSKHCTACQWLFTFQCCLPHLSPSAVKINNDFTEHITCYSDTRGKAMSTQYVTIRYNVRQHTHFKIVTFCDYWRQHHGQHATPHIHKLADSLFACLQVTTHKPSALYLYIAIMFMNYGLPNIDIFHIIYKFE
jgi:hypothetical protein